MILDGILFSKPRFGILWIGVALFSMSWMALAGDVPEGPTARFGKTRQWADATGKFKITAKLVQADPKSIQLEKGDGRVVTIELQKMSEPDQAFVTAFLDASEATRGVEVDSKGGDNPFHGGVPKLDGRLDRPDKPTRSNRGRMNDEGPSVDGSFKDADGIPMIQLNTNKAEPIAINFALPFWKAGVVTPMKLGPVKDQIVAVPFTRGFFDSAMMCVAGVKRNAIVSIYNAESGGQKKYSRLSTTDIQSAEVKPIGQYSDSWRVYAMSPNGKQFLAVNVSMWHRGNDLALFEQTKEGSFQAQFQFTAGGGNWAELMWVGFLSNTRILTVSQKNDLTIWDLESKRATHRGNTGGPLHAPIAGQQRAAIGGQGELIAVPSTNAIAFLRGEDGKQVGLIKVDGTSTPAIAFSPDGQFVAASVPFAVHVYSLRDGSLVKSISIAENNPNGSIEWIDKCLLVNQKLLLDVEKGMPVWSYEIQGANATAVFGGQLYALFASDKGGSIVACHLPHFSMDDIGRKADAKDLYVLGPGSKFRIDTNFHGMTPDEQRGCRSAIADNLTKMGWVEDNGATNEVRLGLVQGEREETEYVESRHPFGFGVPIPSFHPFGRSSGPTTKATAIPWHHTIVVLAGGTEVYRTEITVGTPGSAQLKEGETVQQAIDRTCQPSPSFFTMAQIPKRIMKPEFRDGFGRSKITDKGIQ